MSMCKPPALCVSRQRECEVGRLSMRARLGGLKFSPPHLRVNHLHHLIIPPLPLLLPSTLPYSTLYSALYSPLYSTLLTQARIENRTRMLGARTESEES
jgi:hypothetical protein